MQRWSGRVALVTGASAGIGAAIAKQLVDHGLLVVGMARRVDKIEEAVGVKKSSAADAKKGGGGKLFTIQGDVRKEKDILSVFKWIKENLAGVDVMVNNAGLMGESTLTDCEVEEWRRQLEVNVLGLSICTREAIKSMRERGVNDGHVIHISSVAGHVLPENSVGAMYVSTKHAVRALTEGLRKDLAASKSHIRVSSISPGLVKTEFLNNNVKFRPEDVYSMRPALTSEDVASAAIYALGAPPHVQIHDIIMRPL